jgi:hypothetical protein
MVLFLLPPSAYRSQHRLTPDLAVEVVAARYRLTGDLVKERFAGRPQDLLQHADKLVLRMFRHQFRQNSILAR